jgi:hypothetical protein
VDLAELRRLARLGHREDPEITGLINRLGQLTQQSTPTQPGHYRRQYKRQQYLRWLRYRTQQRTLHRSLFRQVQTQSRLYPPQWLQQQPPERQQLVQLDHQLRQPLRNPLDLHPQFRQDLETYLDQVECLSPHPLSHQLQERQQVHSRLTSAVETLVEHQSLDRFMGCQVGLKIPHLLQHWLLRKVMQEPEVNLYPYLFPGNHSTIHENINGGWLEPLWQERPACMQYHEESTQLPEFLQDLWDILFIDMQLSRRSTSEQSEEH